MLMDHNSYSRLMRKNSQYAIMEPYVEGIQHFQDFKKELAVIKCPTEHINYNFDIKDQHSDGHVKSTDEKELSPRDNILKLKQHNGRKVKRKHTHRPVTSTDDNEISPKDDNLKLKQHKGRKVKLKRKERLKGLFAHQNVLYTKNKLIINTKRFLQPKHVINFLVSSKNDHRLSPKQQKRIVKEISNYPERNQRYLGKHCKAFLAK